MFVDVRRNAEGAERAMSLKTSSRFCIGYYGSSRKRGGHFDRAMEDLAGGEGGGGGQSEGVREEVPWIRTG